MELFGYRFGFARLPAPRAHRFHVERYGDVDECGVEVSVGRSMVWTECRGAPWFEDVRAFGYRFGVDRNPTPWQRGFWIDRVNATLTRIGLGVPVVIALPGACGATTSVASCWFGSSGVDAAAHAAAVGLYAIGNMRLRHVGLASGYSTSSENFL